MKPIHLYKLNAIFNDGFTWDMNIVAIDMHSALTHSISHENQSPKCWIIDVKCVLVKKDYMLVKDDLVSRTID
jgi:hypothetical protein